MSDEVEMALASEFEFDLDSSIDARSYKPSIYLEIVSKALVVSERFFFESFDFLTFMYIWIYY
jgi:hypothetical protein